MMSLPRRASRWRLLMLTAVTAALSLVVSLVGTPNASALVPTAPTGCTATAQSVAADYTGGVPIPDDGIGLVERTVAIPVAAGADYIWDLDVTTRIPHSASGDIEASLTSPLGTTVQLTSGYGGAFSNVFDGTRFDDQSGNDAATFAFADGATAPDLRADGGMSNFIGKRPWGTWFLVVRDTVTGGGSGALNGWSLDITSCDKPANTAAPTITGMVAEGKTLTTSPGTWSGADTTLTYVWQHCLFGGCVPIASTNSPTYVLSSRDRGWMIAVAVTATNPGGAVTAMSAITGTVALPEYNGDLHDTVQNGTPPYVAVATPPLNVAVKVPKVMRASKVAQGLVVSVTSSEDAALKLDIRLNAKVAKQLKLPVLLATRNHSIHAGPNTVRLRFSNKVAKQLAARLRAPKKKDAKGHATRRSLKLTVVVTVTDAWRKHRTTTRSLTIKR